MMIRVCVSIAVGVFLHGSILAQTDVAPKRLTPRLGLGYEFSLLFREIDNIVVTDLGRFASNELRTDQLLVAELQESFKILSAYGAGSYCLTPRSIVSAGIGLGLVPFGVEKSVGVIDARVVYRHHLRGGPLFLEAGLGTMVVGTLLENAACEIGPYGILISAGWEFERLGMGGREARMWIPSLWLEARPFVSTKRVNLHTELTDGIRGDIDSDFLTIGLGIRFYSGTPQ